MLLYLNNCFFCSDSRLNICVELGLCTYEECIISACRVVLVNEVYSVGDDGVWDFLIKLFTMKTDSLS